MQETTRKKPSGSKLLERFAPVFAAACILGCFLGTQAFITAESAIRSMSSAASSGSVTMTAPSANNAGSSTTVRDVLSTALDSDAKHKASEQSAPAASGSRSAFSIGPIPSSYSEIKEQFVGFLEPFVEGGLAASGDFVVSSGLYNPDGDNSQLLDLILVFGICFVVVAWLFRKED